MGDRSKIEWTDASWNPIRARRRATGQVGFHCEHLSEGCRNCYAETHNRRGLPNGGTGLDYKPGHRDAIDIFLDETRLLAPLRWRRPRMIFVCSMTDLFADFVTDEMVDRIFAVMALCPYHTFQVLTKRPERMRQYVSRMCNRDDLIADAAVAIARAVKGNSESLHRTIMVGVRSPLPNVWFGTSCENQPTADVRILELIATPAAVRFVSMEPMLGPTRVAFQKDHCDLCGGTGMLARFPLGKCRHCDGRGYVWICGPKRRDGYRNLDWVIVGGESGPRARPMHPQWARDIRDQCAAAGVPFFFKQRGNWTWLEPSDGSWPIDTETCISLNEDGSRGIEGWPMQRVGKTRAGRLLDGVEHNGMPRTEARAA